MSRSLCFIAGAGPSLLLCPGSGPVAARVPARAADGSVVADDDGADGAEQGAAPQHREQRLQLEHVLGQRAPVALPVAVAEPARGPVRLRAAVAVLVAAGGRGGAALGPGHLGSSVGRGRAAATPLPRPQQPEGPRGEGGEVGGEEDEQELRLVTIVAVHMSQMLYAGQSDRENVTFFSDF